MQKFNPLDKPHWHQYLVIMGIILFAVAIALWQMVPPHLIPATAPLTEFSADRAMPDLKVIAQAPHPIGSTAHAAVRKYLMTQLKAMGLQPEIQSTTVVQPGDGGFGVGRVQNVLVRIPGKASTGAIVLDAHYDTADTGPGASDCGSCVVTGLETLRAIRAGTPLNNDLIFVFADGEEVGMLGARAFATEHPWAKDVKLAMGSKLDCQPFCQEVPGRA
jgi:acetylornithine deacetylase/succinyl-diaminopimelate desuccinylase-like protein